MEVRTDGWWRHYKGKEYQVLGVAKHSETLEDLVVYKCLYENELNKLWVRPKDDFLGTVNVKGLERSRFQHVEGSIE